MSERDIAHASWVTLAYVALWSPVREASVTRGPRQWSSSLAHYEGLAFSAALFFARSHADVRWFGRVLAIGARCLLRVGRVLSRSHDLSRSSHEPGSKRLRVVGRCESRRPAWHAAESPL